MPAVSKKQQRFFGMVRAAQKGEMENPSPEISKVAATTSMSSVKKFAKTKHKGLPEKKVASEGVVDAIKKIKLNKTKVKKSPYSGRDAGAIAAKVMRQKQHNKYVNFLPMDEEKKKDHEPEMIRSQLKTAKKASKVIKKHTLKKDNFKAWVQSKITKASDYLDTAADYLDSKDMKEALDQKDKPFVKDLVKKLRGGSKTHAKQADDLEKAMNEGSLRSWFKGSKSKDGKPGWVNVKTGGTCASDEPGEGTPKCVSSSKRASMTKAERESASRRKKAADPGQQSKSGAAKPTYVSTDSPRKKKMKEEINLTEVKDKKGKGSGSKDACYHKVKSRYSVWPSAYASGALVKCRKVGAANWGNSSKKEEFEPTGISLQQFTEKCWKGYEKKGMKTMFGKRYPNCVKKEETEVVNEVSSKTLRNYIIKGTKDVAKRASDPDSDSGPKYGKKMSRMDGVMTAADKLAKKASKNEEVENVREGDGDPCWDTHKQVGMKKKGGKMVPNCVPKTKNEEVIPEAKYETGASTYGKATIRNKRKFGTPGELPDIMTGKKITKDATRGELINKRREEHKAKRGVKEEVKRDEYGDPIGGPKISKKQLKKNLTANTPDEQHTTTTSEAASWTKKSGKNPSGGLNEKGRKSYERENPGSDLKRPSKKVGNKRRASFCARMKGMKKKLTSAKTANDPDSRINKSLRAWNC